MIWRKSGSKKVGPFVWCVLTVTLGILPFSFPLDTSDDRGSRLLQPRLPESSHRDLNRDTQADSGVADCYGCIYLPMVRKDFSSSSLEYDVQGCLATTVRGEDWVAICLEGDDIVVRHDNVTYNCCAQIVVHLIDERPVLKLVECEDFAGGEPCRCWCPYDIRARVPDLPSGRYQVEVWNCDQSHLYGEAEVTVP